MRNAYDLATRILFVYELKLPPGQLPNLTDRVQAMHDTIKALGLTEEGGADLKAIARAEGCVTT